MQAQDDGPDRAPPAVWENLNTSWMLSFQSLERKIGSEKARERSEARSGNQGLPGIPSIPSSRPAPKQSDTATASRLDKLRDHLKQGTMQQGSIAEHLRHVRHEATDRLTPREMTTPEGYLPAAIMEERSVEVKNYAEKLLEQRASERRQEQSVPKRSLVEELAAAVKNPPSQGAVKQGDSVPSAPPPTPSERQLQEQYVVMQQQRHSSNGHFPGSEWQMAPPAGSSPRGGHPPPMLSPMQPTMLRSGPPPQQMPQQQQQQQMHAPLPAQPGAMASHMPSPGWEGHPQEGHALHAAHQPPTIVPPMPFGSRSRSPPMMRSVSPQRSAADATFDAIDRNHDGVVDRSEFRAAVEAAQHGQLLAPPMHYAQQPAHGGFATSRPAPRQAEVPTAMQPAETARLSNQIPVQVYPGEGGEAWPRGWQPQPVAPQAQPSAYHQGGTSANPGQYTHNLGPNRAYIEAYSQERARHIGHHQPQQAMNSNQPAYPGATTVLM